MKAHLTCGSVKIPIVVDWGLISRIQPLDNGGSISYMPNWKQIKINTKSHGGAFDEEYGEYLEFDKKLFLSKWQNDSLSSPDVEYVLCIDKELKKNFTKAKVGYSYWASHKIKKLIDEYSKSLNEAWNFPSTSHILCLWDKAEPCKSIPLGIMAFSIEVTGITKSQKANSINISNHLMWIRPDVRGQNFGYHLVAHFIDYLGHCPLNPLIISKRGIDLLYSSEYYSNGGEALSKYIEGHLEYVHDAWKIDGYQRLWPIKSLECETGF